MDHTCSHEADIAKLKEGYSTLKKENDKRDSWQARIEEKLDKILYFFLGQSVGIIASIVVGVILFMVNN